MYSTPVQVPGVQGLEGGAQGFPVHIVRGMMQPFMQSGCPRASNTYHIHLLRPIISRNAHAPSDLVAHEQMRLMGRNGSSAEITAITTVIMRHPTAASASNETHGVNHASGAGGGEGGGATNETGQGVGGQNVQVKPKPCKLYSKVMPILSLVISVEC